jgi:AcrR family transcriptional regulator
VFAESGYRSAKVSDVAARVGVTEPVIFQNFGSKAALFAAVVERAAAEAKHSLDELAAGPGPASGLLAHVLARPATTDPGHATPGHATPGHATPGHATPGHATPGHATPGHATPGHATPGHATPGHAAPPGTRSGGGEQAGIAFGVLFADAAALAGEPELAGPAGDAVRAVAAHLADLVRHAQAGGGVRPDVDPEAAAWLLLSVLAARRVRAASMPDEIEPAVIALALQAIASPAAHQATGPADPYA